MINHTKTISAERFLAFLLCAAVIIAMLAQLIPAFFMPIKAEATEGAVPEFKTFADLTGKTVAMLTGAPFEELVLEKNPDVKEIQYFSTPTDMILALKTDKIDAFLANNAAASMMVNQDSTLAVFPESLEDTDFGFAFKKGDPAREKWQAAFDSLSRERIDELWDAWIGTDESKKILPEQDWSGTNGTVKVAACDSVPPMCYAGNNGELVGFDIAVMLEIARVLDVHLDFTGMEFASVMAEVESGKAQVGSGSFVLNEERRKLMDFVTYHEASYVMLVRAEDGGISAQQTASVQKTVTVPEYTSLSELNGRKFGLVNGSPFAEIIESKVSDVDEYLYFSSIPDMALALKAGKIDAFLTGDTVADTMISEDAGLAAFPIPFGELEYAFALQKGNPMTKQWQNACQKVGEERIQELYEIWLGTDDSKKILPEQDWAGANGTVRVASGDNVPPVSYVAENGRLEGFEIAVLLEMAKELDVHLDFTGMELSSLLTSLQTGKVDISNSCLAVTEERQKALDLVSYRKGSYVLVVRAKEKTVTAPEFSSFADLDGKTVAMLAGAPFEEMVREKNPDIGGVQYFATVADMQLALQTGKIDAFVTNNAVAAMLSNQDIGLAVFPESLGDTYYGFAFKKGDPLRDEWQAAYDSLDQERISELWDIWLGTDDSKKVLPAQDWSGANGTIKVASCDSLPPMSYAGENGEPTGFDIAVLLEMAKVLDVHLDFTGLEFSGIMAEVESGKAQVGNGSIMMTEERKALMDFVPYHEASFVLIVRAAEQTVEQPTFADSLKASFERTFITDARWKMILLGLLRTVIIAICAGVLGTLLGFGLVLLRHQNNAVTNKLIAVYSSLITGIPVVVILMVLYYIVFGKLDAPAMVVAIIGFTVIFGARAYGLIWNAVTAVDTGQREAALALGYSEKLAFRRVILPQSRSLYFQPLKIQMVMLLKETSVAGYITVLEMTRAVDLVRSRTMEAFFPLITAAAIYFVLTWLLTKLISTAEQYLEKKHEQRKIKGVD